MRPLPPVGVDGSFAARSGSDLAFDHAGAVEAEAFQAVGGVSVIRSRVPSVVRRVPVCRRFWPPALGVETGERSRTSSTSAAFGGGGG